MTDRLKELLSKLQEEKQFLQRSNEEAIKQGAVLPILACLGWDRDNIREVVPEYSVGNGRVDYCLKTGEQPNVFVEAKRAGQELDSHQQQLLRYSFEQGVPLAVLTNGLVWWFYLPLSPGNWEGRRKFYAIDIGQQELNMVAAQFVEFLSRRAIEDGSAIKRAQATQKDREKQRKIRTTLPKAWRKLCEEPDELLVELLVEKVEAICGHRPENNTAATFLLKVIERPDTGNHSNGPKEPAPEGLNWRGKDVTGRKPAWYSLKDHREQVSKWRDLLTSFCDHLYRIHGREFEEKVLSLTGFDRDRSVMHTPQEIDDSGIYVEVHRGAVEIKKRCYQILDVLGYNEHDFKLKLLQTKH